MATVAVALLAEVKGRRTRRPTPVPRHTLAHSPQMGGHSSAPSSPPHCSTSTRSPSRSCNAARALEFARSKRAERLPTRALCSRAAELAPADGAAPSGVKGAARSSPLGWWT